MKNNVKIGIIGLGTVGSAVVSVIKRNARIIRDKAGVSIEIKKAADIRIAGKKNLGVPVTSNASEIIKDPQINIMVEAIGGVYPAKKFILDAIKNKKHVVTSNKEVIAKHGDEIFKAAAKNKVKVLYEAAVGMYNVINVNMASAIREVSINQGYDPGDFPLVVAGGA